MVFGAIVIACVVGILCGINDGSLITIGAFAVILTVYALIKWNSRIPFRTRE